jgi:putative salt-induced outer membrane protein YdiY
LKTGIGVRLACGVFSAAVGCSLAPAQEPAADENRWRDTAEFSFVATAGNADTQTLGFKNKLWRKWDVSSFELNAGGVRSEGTTNRRAVGTVDSFRLEDDSELTAENYFLNGRYDREITKRFFWFAGAGWDRNTFAGIDNRYTAVGGVGNIWVDSETVKFRTDYAVTFTRQDDVVDIADMDDSFLGLRVSWHYLHKFGATTEYTNDLVVDENLDETDDWRANMINSVSVVLNKRLALKVSLQFLYDNQPSFEELPLFDTAGVDTGTAVLAELDELDTVFTSSLVMSF